MAPEPLDFHAGSGPLRPHATYFETQSAGLAAPTSPSLSLPARFDLSVEVEEDRTRLRGAIQLRWALGVGVLLLAILLLGVGGYSGSLLLLLPGGFLVAIAITLLWVIVSIDRWPRAIVVEPDGLRFEFSRRRRPILVWWDPSFELLIRETPLEVNRAARAPKDTPTYRLYTSPPRRGRRLPRVVVGVPPELVRAVLDGARAHRLAIGRDLEGDPGTGSERLVYRIRATKESRAEPPTGSFPTAPTS